MVKYHSGGKSGQEPGSYVYGQPETGQLLGGEGMLGV